MAEAEENEELKLHYSGDETLKDCIERNFEHVKVNCSLENLWLNGKQRDLRKIKEAFHEVNVDHEKKQLILTEPSTLEYLNTKIVETENCCLLKGRDSIYVFIPHRRKDDCIKQMGKLVQDEICKIDGIVVNTDDLLLDYAGKICRCGTSVLVFTKDILKQVNKFIQQTGTDDDSTKETPAIKETQGNPLIRQTELEVKCSGIVLDDNDLRMADAEEKESVTLDYYGDETLKDCIERNFVHVKVNCTWENLWLNGKQRDLRKIKEAFHEVNVDHERKQLILTEPSILKYLNTKIVETENCCLLKGIDGIYVFIPHKKKDDCIKQMGKLVQDEICKIDEITINTDDLLLDYAGKICRCGTSVLVFTKDIVKQVNKFIQQTGRDDDFTKETSAIKETQGNPLGRKTELEVKCSGIVLDDNGKLFIERHCPNVSIHRTTTGFSLHTKSADPSNTAVYVIPLDVDKNRMQLILKGDGIIDFLNKKLQGENIVCYLVKHKSRLYGLMPLDYKDYKQKVLNCVNENICIKEIDKPVDDEMIYDVSKEFSGNITCIVTHKSVLVYTKSVEVQVDEYMKKVNQDNSCQKEYPNRMSDSGSDTEGEYETVTDPGGTTLKGTRGSDKMDNYDKGDKNRESCATVDDSGNQETEFVEGNIIEESFEAIDIHSVYMDADLADYMFNYRRDEIRKLEKQSYIISNSNGTVTFHSKNCQYIEDGMKKIAQNACMQSFYIDGDKFKTSRTEPFQDMLEKLQQEGTHIKMHPCFLTRVVTHFLTRNVTIELVYGSAADIQQTDTILCPLNSNLNDACASAGHIMAKGGEALKQLCVKPASKSKEFPSFHFQIFKNPDSKLLVKTVFGIVLDDWYHGPKDYEEKLQMKIRHLFQQVIDKHFQTVAIPLEIGERVPVLVMARACIRAFNAFQAERPGSILKRVSLCVVDTSCLPSLMDLFRSEFDTVVEDPKKASLDPLGVSALQREKQREDDNSNIDYISPVQVYVKVGSLTDQKVEAIVVPVSNNLNLNTGQLSRAVAREAGEDIVTELKSKHSKGLGPFEVIYTGPGNLQLKNVLYSNLPKLKEKYGSPEWCISMLMENIFKTLQKLKIKTVALPAFGTGSFLCYPEEIVAVEMVRSIYLHAACSGVQLVNLIAFKKETRMFDLFSDAAKTYRIVREQLEKDARAGCVAVDIRCIQGKQNFTCKIVERNSEAPMCDVMIYHRKLTEMKNTDKHIIDGLSVRDVEKLSNGLIQKEMFIDLSYVNHDTDKADKLYKKCLEHAVKTLGCHFLMIDLNEIKPQEEARIIIEKLLKILHNVWKEADRLKQIHFLVKKESFQSCKKYAAQNHKETAEKRKRKPSVFSSITGAFLGGTLLLDWQIVPYKILDPVGAYVVVCSKSEKEMGSAVHQVKEELSYFRNNLDDSDTENHEADGAMWRHGRFRDQKQNASFPHKIPQSNYRVENETANGQSPPLPKRDKKQEQPETFHRPRSESADDERPPLPQRNKKLGQPKAFHRQRSEASDEAAPPLPKRGEKQEQPKAMSRQNSETNDKEVPPRPEKYKEPEHSKTLLRQNSEASDEAAPPLPKREEKQEQPKAMSRQNSETNDKEVPPRPEKCKEPEHSKTLLRQNSEASDEAAPPLPKREEKQEQPKAMSRQNSETNDKEVSPRPEKCKEPEHSKTLLRQNSETNDKEVSPRPEKYKEPKHWKTLLRQNSGSREMDLPHPYKGQTIQNQTKPTYVQRSPFKMLKAEVPKTITRHFSKTKMDHVLRILQMERKISCKREGEVIKVEVEYDERDRLSDALEKGLIDYDKTRYYIREVSPQLVHLFKLYLETTKGISGQDWQYSEMHQEIEIYGPEKFYNQLKEKCEHLKQYQVDTIDVTRAKHLVDDVLKEFRNEHLQHENSEFSGILVEAVSENQAINIHYLADEQEKLLRVKNMLQIRLGLIKQTGRRNRAFTRNMSLDTSFILNSHSDQTMRDTPIGKMKPGQMPSTMSRHHSTSLPQLNRRELKKFDNRSDVRDVTYLTENKLSLKVYKGDILKLNVDCIVNAANEDLAHGGGVAWAISRAAGHRFNVECRDYIKSNGQLNISECIRTGPGNLPYRCVLHAVGPRWGDYTEKENCKDALRKTIINILKCADDERLKSVAIPSISSGIFGVPWEICAEMYAQGVLKFEEQVTSTSLREIHFVDINEEILKVIRAEFDHIFTVQVSRNDVEDEIY